MKNTIIRKTKRSQPKKQKSEWACPETFEEALAFVPPPPHPLVSAMPRPAWMKRP